VVASIFRYLEYIFLQKGANSIIKKMRNDVFEHVQTLPIRYFDSLPAGKVVSRITNDTEAIRELFVTVLSQFATSFMYMAGIYAALFYLDWQLAAMMLVLIPLLYGWMLVYRKFAAKYNHVVREKLSDMNADRKSVV